MLQTFFTLLAPYFVSIIIIFGSSIVAWIINISIKHYLRKIEGQRNSKTIIIVLRNLHPLYFLIIIVGFYFAYEVLPFAQLTNLITNPTEAMYNAWITGGFFVVLVLLICYVAIDVIKIFIDRYFIEQRGALKTPAIIMKVVGPLVLTVGVFIILSHFSVDIIPLLTTFGIGGIAVGLALQPTLTNLFAGLSIITDRPINVGDYVEVDTGQIAGYVHDIGWFSTRIRTFSNVTIVLPNSRLLSSVVSNYATADPKFCIVPVGINYDQDIEHISQLAKKVAEEVLSVMPGADTDRTPVVSFDSLDSNRIVFKVIMYIEKLEAQFAIKTAFVKELKKKFDEEGIKFL